MQRVIIPTASEYGFRISRSHVTRGKRQLTHEGEHRTHTCVNRAESGSVSKAFSVCLSIPNAAAVCAPKSHTKKLSLA
jgi:hypothetical protein